MEDPSRQGSLPIMMLMTLKGDIDLYLKDTEFPHTIHRYNVYDYYITYKHIMILTTFIYFFILTALVEGL